MYGSSSAFGLPDWDEQGTISTGGKGSARPAKLDASEAQRTTACAWADLVDWIAHLAESHSECLPAALWLLSRSRSTPWEFLRPTASDRETPIGFSGLLEPLRAELMAARAQDPSGFEQGTPTWCDLAEWIRRLADKAPLVFRAHVSAFFAFAEVLGDLLVSGQPSTAEFEAVLDDLDRHQVRLLPAVLELMASIPHTCQTAARWERRETTPQERIARKLASFNAAALRLINSRDTHAAGQTAELFQCFRDLPEPAREAVPVDGVADLPLNLLLAIEQIIDDGELSIPRKAVAVHRLRVGEISLPAPCFGQINGSHANASGAPPGR